MRTARTPEVPLHCEARMAVFEFIEGWYNPRRRHSAIGKLLDYLKREQERLAATRRGGLLPQGAIAEIKQHVWLTCNRPPFIDSSGRACPDTQDIVEANRRYMNQRGDPQELDRLIREVEKIVRRRPATPPAVADGLAA